MILLYADIARPTSDHMHVRSYNDREELRGGGIATDFYARLDNLGRKLGIRYISGLNNDGNIGFFTRKLGRTRLLDMPPSVQTEIKANITPLSIMKSDYPNVTVASL